jgi:hypothetical protein
LFTEKNPVMLVFAAFEPLVEGVGVVGAVAFSGDPLVEGDLADVALIDLEEVLVGFGDVVGAIEVEEFLGGESGGEEGVGEGVGLAIAFLGALEDGADEGGGKIGDGLDDRGAGCWLISDDRAVKK